MGKWAKTLGDYYCPSCGFLGQLKLCYHDDRKKSYPWYRMDHYKDKRTGKIRQRLPLRRGRIWAYSCYLGKIVVTDGYDFLWPPPSLVAVGKLVFPDIQPVHP